MLKDMLLQLLIVFLPVFLLLVWYDRPGRTRYVPALIGVSSGIAMLLCMHFSVYVPENGMSYDFRHVPLIIGSLFGGVPTAIVLTIIYVAARFPAMKDPEDYIFFASFLLLVLPLLIGHVQSFARGNRVRRQKISYYLSLIILVFILFNIIASMDFNGYAHFFTVMGRVLLFGALFIVATSAGVHFIELGIERVQLQTQLRDVSHQYRKEARRLQQFLDSAPLEVLFVNEKGTITHANENMKSALKSNDDSYIVGRHYSDALRHFADIGSGDPFERVLSGEDQVTKMIQYQGRTYFSRTCLVKGLPEQSAPGGVLFIAHDVTELQQLKDEVGRMERLSLVGQMAASITHEIRNPMAVIRGFVQLLNERSPSEQQAYFRIVMDELDRVGCIINDFLSLAQNRIVEKKPANLHGILSDLLPLLHADANMRGQIIELRLCEEMEELELSSKEIKQLLLNLARNGMEAMDDKGVLVIETRNMADIVQLRIIDNGIGIPKEKLDRLFEPFYTTKSNGTGLGLALCLSIAERHHGTIQVESVAGEGTTLIVSFRKWLEPAE